MAGDALPRGPLDPRSIIGFYHVNLRYRDQTALSGRLVHRQTTANSCASPGRAAPARAASSD